MQRDSIFNPPAAWMQGAQLGRVLSLDDPTGENRVQVELLAFTGSETQEAVWWARVVCPFAGANRGAFWLPDVNDEVLVMFLQGDARHPFVMGGLWNGSAAAPASITAGRNETKRLRSANGLTFTMKDVQGQEELTLETPGGCKLLLKDGPGNVKLEDSNGNSVEFTVSGITVNSPAMVQVNASSVEISAALVRVNAALSQFNGMVKCDMLQTNAVISSSYTPGAGNVW